jgi:hypothetical protein
LLQCFDGFLLHALAAIGDVKSVEKAVVAWLGLEALLNIRDCSVILARQHIGEGEGARGRAKASISVAFFCSAMAS